MSKNMLTADVPTEPTEPSAQEIVELTMPITSWLWPTRKRGERASGY